MYGKRSVDLSSGSYRVRTYKLMRPLHLSVAFQPFVRRYVFGIWIIAASQNNNKKSPPPLLRSINVFALNRVLNSAAFLSLDKVSDFCISLPVIFSSYLKRRDDTHIFVSKFGPNMGHSVLQNSFELLLNCFRVYFSWCRSPGLIRV